MSTAESYIQLPTDGQGKKHRTITETVSGSEVHHPVMMLADPSGTAVAVTSGITVSIGHDIDISATVNTSTRITDGTDTLSIDTNGNAMVAGTNTPGNAGILLASAPTDAINNRAFTYVYDTAGSLQMIRASDTTASTIATSVSGNPQTISKLYLYNGTAWFKANGDTTNGLDVDVTRLPFNVVTDGSQISARTVSGHKASFNVHMDVQNASGTVGYMLIDLSDTTNWPHTNAGSIVIEKIVIAVNPSSAFLGDIEFGFLSGAGATDSDFNKVYVIHGERGAQGYSQELNYAHIGLPCTTTSWFGPVTANDTTFQTDVNLLGPDGNTSYPSGDGDFVMKLISTAGNVDIGVTISYTTEA